MHLPVVQKHVSGKLQAKSIFKPLIDSFCVIVEQLFLINNNKCIIKVVAFIPKAVGKDWNGEYDEAALTILHQHAIQGDLTEIQQSMCQWTSSFKIHIEKNLDCRNLVTLCQKFDELWEEESFSWEEVSKHFFTDMKDNMQNTNIGVRFQYSQIKLPS